MMIDALIKGPSPAIIIEKLASAPPLSTLIKLRNWGELDELNKFCKTWCRVLASAIGTGI